MTIAIRWRKNFRAGMPAEIVYEAIERIREQTSAVGIGPEELLAEASDSESVLHKHFEWDDRVAGHRWRIHQARNLIGALIVVDVERKLEQPAFVSVIYPGDEEEDVRGYVPLAVAASDPDMRQCAIREALRGLRAWQRRHKAVKGFEPVHRAIDEIGEVLDSEAKVTSG